MTSEIRTAIGRGLGFLVANQLKSGEFPTLLAREESMRNGSYIRSVFVTSFVLHSLQFLREWPEAESIGARAVPFLLAERDQAGFWRVLSDRRVPPDVDCNCCVLASLKEWGVELDYGELAARILQYRLDGGAFLTWVLDSDTSCVQLKNDLDWVVNANALFCFSLLGYPLSFVELYLEEIIRRGFFEGPTRYYPSPFSFTYCFTRAVADGNAPNPAKLLPKIAAFAEEKQDGQGSFGTPLEDALATVSWLNCNTNLSSIDKAIANLLVRQASDGGWPDAVFFKAPPSYYFGSRALTTALAIEGLTKYLLLTAGDLCEK